MSHNSHFLTNQALEFTRSKFESQDPLVRVNRETWWSVHYALLERNPTNADFIAVYSQIMSDMVWM